MVLTIIAVLLLIIVLSNETARLILLGIVGITLGMVFFVVAASLFFGAWLYLFGSYFF